MAKHRSHTLFMLTLLSLLIAAPLSSAANSVSTLPAIRATPSLSVLPAVRRLIAIGDIHGDMKALKIILRSAGLINAALNWTGGDTVVVQTGDIMDRARQVVAGEIFNRVLLCSSSFGLQSRTRAARRRSLPGWSSCTARQ